MGGVNITYVIRFDAEWNTRQFMLFRDLDEPDLWLANDGTGLWGETNGVVRKDLTGCTDIAMTCTPFSASTAIRRLITRGQTAASFTVAMLDVETLGLVVHEHEITQLAEDRWHHRSHTTGRSYEVDVDEFGLVVDEPDRFKRL